MAAEPPEEGFKVTDRRRRGDPPDTAPPGPPGGLDRPVVEPRAESSRAPEVEAPGGDERSLVGLFMMLGSSALLALGDAPDPMTGLRQVDLPGAADIIDTLVLLREKTQGRRSAEETQVLDELLYDLQMRYVRATAESG